MKNIAIILASGEGRRMKSYRIRKGFIPLLGTPIYQYSLNTFSKLDDIISSIILVVPLSELGRIKEEIKDYHHVEVISGGNSRQESVKNALEYLKNKNVDDNDYILIHDAARALISKDNIISVLDDAYKYGASVLAIKATNTILKVDDNSNIIDIPLRNELYEEQTPAVFKFKDIYQAHQIEGIDSSDDCSLIRKLGISIHITLGGKNNFKITTDEDILLAEAMIKQGK